MKNIVQPVLFSLCLLSTISFHTASATWIAKTTDGQINQQQIQSYLKYQHTELKQIPASKRKQLLESWYIRESLSTSARKKKLDKSTEYQQAVQEFEKDLLAKLALSLASKENLPDFSLRAKEIYQSKKAEKYQLPVRLRVKQIILNKEQKQLAQDLYQKLKQGNITFDQAISEYSTEPQKHRSKGLSYWFHQEQKTAEFYDKAKLLNEDNHLSKPFAANGKLFILEYVGQKEAKTIHFDEAKKDIISQLQQEYIETERKLLLEEIKQQFTKNVQINPSFLNLKR